MLKLLMVGAGGFVGSIGRYLVGVGAQRITALPGFPYGTLIVNIVGCLLIGLLAGLVEGRPGGMSDEMELLLFVGALGGFTTFSSFGLDSVQLMRGHSVGLALMNVIVQVVVGLLAVWGGLELVRWLVRVP
jgi:fluoride exporter